MISPSRLIAALAVFFVCVQGFSQNIRSEVALIKPKLDEEARAGFIRIADSLATQGYNDSADYFRGWAESGHGSGVLVKDPKGQIVLVTNRHVAAFSETADVIFRALDGTETTWPGCPVLYTDPFIDIAVIGLPAGVSAIGLPLSSSVTEDMDVWSAGFPGLAGRPEWQLAKGTLTNAAVTIPELGREKDAVFYQHSASIDPGNSGGPLLTGDPSKPASLQVIGINSYSVSNRNNTYFSVPAAKVQEALNRYVNRGTANLNDTSAAFAAFLNASEWDKFAFRQFISYHFASALGWTNFQTAAKTMTDKEWSVWYARFSASPLDALAQFLSYQLWQRVHAASDELVYSGTDSSGAVPVSHFSLDKKPVEVTWVSEAGSYKVASVDLAGTPIAAADKPRQKVPEGRSLHIGTTIPLGDAWTRNPGFAFGFDGESQVSGPTTLVTRFHFSQDSPGKGDYSSDPPETKLNFLEAGLGLRYYWVTPQPSGAYWAPFVQASANADFALPMLQSSFFRSIGSNSTDSPHLTFLFAGVLEPTVGIEGSFDGNIAFGVETGARWFSFGLSGVKTLPLGIYVKLLDHSSL